MKNTKKQQQRGKNSLHKGHTREKMLFMMLVLAGFILFSMGNISALDWDNGLIYENKDMTVLVEDGYWFGIGEWFGFNTELGRATLSSHKSVEEILNVGFGKEAVVMYYDFEGWELYEDGLGEVDFIDMNTGKGIEKDYYFVEWKEIEFDVDDWDTVCKSFLINGTGSDCTYKLVGSHKEMRFDWVKLKNNDIPARDMRIGLKTYVGKDDWIDGVWTIAGKKVKKHITWTGDLDTGNLLYFKLDETSGAVLDATGNDDAENRGATPNVAGKINTAYEFDGASTYINDTSISLTDISASFWIYTFTDTSSRTILDVGDLLISKNTVNQIIVNTAGTSATSNITLVNQSWSHVVVIINATGTTIYVNGTDINGTIAGYKSSDFTSGASAIGSYEIGAGHGQYWLGKIDEVGFWNRELSIDEIEFLYNDYDGCAYGNDACIGISPTITLDAPANNTNFTTTNNIVMNATIFDDWSITNASLIINNSYNETNLTAGVNNSIYTFTKNMGEGLFYWTIEACDNSSLCINASQRTFDVNTTPNIVYGEGVPVNEYNSSINSFEVNVTLTETLFQNVTFDLYNVNGALNQTETFTDATRSKVWTNLIDATYSYNVTTATTTNQFNNTATRNITIDVNPPSVIILAPSTTIDSHVLNTNIFFNWSANDTHLSHCIYEYEGVNTTVTCSDNTTEINITNTVNRTIIFYVNDTFGNINVTSRTWGYNFLETGSSYTADVFETKNYTFELNVTSYQTLTSFSAFLIHNGTTYSADSSCNGGNCEISAHIDIPLLNTGQTTENKTFLWRLSIFNGTGTSNINTSTQTQNVTAVNFVECGAAPIAIKFTIHNETDRVDLTHNYSLNKSDPSFNAYFQYYLGTGSVIKEGNSSQTNKSSYNFCIDQSETFYVSSSIDLSATDYESRHYDFVKEIYTNSTTIQQLYLLNSTLASVIIIEVKDQGLIPLKDIIVNISRFYPGEGKYYPVENQITDEYGQIVAKLIENDVKYKFNFYNLDKTLLKTTELISIACRTTICFLPFVIEDLIDEFERFDNLTTYSYTFAFDNTTNVFAFSWDDQRGESTTTRLEVIRYQLNASSVVCNTSSTSTLSTLTCNVGAQRASYKAQVFRTEDGDTRRITILNIKVGDLASTYGVEGLFWVFILLFTMIGLGAYNPSLGIGLFGVGFIMMGVVGLISMPLPVFFAVTLLVILFIYGVNK